MPIDAIVLNIIDNVATAVQNLKARQKAMVQLERDIQYITLKEDIPYGHKFAFRSICQGEEILKYGEVMGRATADIQAGCHAHVQNIESLRGRGDLQKEA